MSEVLPATENDLKVILGWLEREYEEDEEGFWSNRCTITRSFREEGDLWVISKDGEAAAFQVSQVSSLPALLCPPLRFSHYWSLLHRPSAGFRQSVRCT